MNFLTKIIDSLTRVNPCFLMAPYILLQAYLYFSPYIHATSGSFYFITADPELFLNDIITTSTLGTSTYYYKFLHLIMGSHMTDPYFLFIPYIISCGLIGYGMYLIGKLVGRESAVGFLALVLLLVDKSPFTGYLSITRPDYNYQHFTLPFLIFAVYFLLKERHLLFALLMAVSFYFHVRNTAVFGLVLFPLVAWRIFQNPRAIGAFILPGLLMVPKVLSLFKSVYAAGAFTAAEKSEYLQLMFLREEEEGAIVFNEAGSLELIVYTMLVAVGLFTAKSVEDRNLRRSIYICHAGVYFAYAVGLFWRVIDHFGFHVGEVSMLGYGRASVVGTMLAVATMANYFYVKLRAGLNAKYAAGIIAVLSLMWFFSVNNLYVKSLSDLAADWISAKMLAKVIFAVFAAGLVFWLVKSTGFNMRPQAVVMAVFLVSFIYTAVKVPPKVYKSYRMQYPYFPLIPDFSAYKPEMSSLRDWSVKNTGKQATFLAIENAGKEEEDYCNGSLRLSLQRSLWCQGFIGAYGNAEAFREWKRRRALLRDFLARPYDQWQPLFDREGIDYVLAEKDIAWPQRNNIVFENERFIVYDVGRNEH